MKGIKSILEDIFNWGSNHASDDYLKHKIYVTNVTALILSTYGFIYLIVGWFTFPFFVNVNLISFDFLILTFFLNYIGYYTISRYLLILNVAVINHYAHILLVQQNEPLIHGILVQQFMLAAICFLFFDKREKHHLIISLFIVFITALSTHLTKAWIELPDSIGAERIFDAQIGSYFGVAIYSFVIYMVQSEAYRNQKNVIESLRQSEGSLRIAQNLADIVYWEVDLNTLKAKIGTQLLKNAGYKFEQEFIEIYFPDYRNTYLIPEDHKIANNLHKRVEANKNNPGYETNTTYRIKGINGDIFYHYCFVRIMESNGQPILFVAVQDITQQQETLNSIRDRERSLNLSTKVGKLSYWHLDEEGNITLGTELLKKAGYDIPENELTLPLAECAQRFCYSDDEELMLTGGRGSSVEMNQLQNDESFSYLYRLTGGDGKTYYHKTFGRTTFEENKKIIYGATQDVTEEQEYIISLRKSEAKLKLAQEINKTVYWEIDIATQTLRLENRLLLLAGYDLPEGIITIPLSAFAHKYMHPEDAILLMETFAYGLTQLDNPNYGFEKNVRMVGAKGDLYYHRIAFYTRHQTSKGVIFGSTQDVTIQVKEEQEFTLVLRKNEASLKLSQQIAQIVHWEWEAESMRLHFDNQLLINAGYDFQPGQISITSSEYIEKYVHPDDKQKLFGSQADTQTKVEDPNAHIEITYRLIGPNGNIRYHNVVALNRYNDKKGVFFGIFQDVTERHENIESLQKNEAALKIAQEMNKTVYWELDMETQLLHIDSRLLTLAGYAFPAGRIAIPIQEIILHYIHPEDASAMMEATTYALTQASDPNEVFEKTYRIVGTKGDIYYHHSVFNIRYQNDKKVLFGVTQDVTSQIHGEQQLLHNQKELLESQRKAAEYQLAALRSQMNPHFIFNCLNSIQNFIAKNDKYNAINYLSKFAKLIRLILEGSKDNYILLADEMKMLEYYIELERMRFPDKFDFSMEIDENIPADTLKIPPMLIQPFIENSILHGLVHKKDKGQLKICFFNNEDKLVCSIIDNGVGREEAARINATKTNTHKSVATQLTRERLQMHNRDINGLTELKITDMFDHQGMGKGTMVEIFLPLK